MGNYEITEDIKIKIKESILRNIPYNIHSHIYEYMDWHEGFNLPSEYKCQIVMKDTLVKLEDLPKTIKVEGLDNILVVRESDCRLKRKSVNRGSIGNITYILVFCIDNTKEDILFVSENREEITKFLGEADLRINWLGDIWVDFPYNKHDYSVWVNVNDKELGFKSAGYSKLNGYTDKTFYRGLIK